MYGAAPRPQQRPNLPVIVHILEPQIAHLVRDQILDVEPVEQVGGRRGANLLAQAAIRHELVGRRCRIAVRHEATKAGKTYAAIAQTFK